MPRMGQDYIAAIDQGTTSSRCIVFDRTGAVVSLDQREHRQSYPRPGWVEHDAEEIWHNVETVTRGALDRAGLSRADLAAIGITNQRETTLLWDARTGEPVAGAIVWQDTRTDKLIAELAGDGGPDRFRDRSGLPLATYFSGPKVRWLLDHDPTLRQRAEDGEIRFGTIDSWLIMKLTGRHATDVTNASRTMLMNLSTLDWDDELLDALGVPRAMLPEILPSSHVYGEATGALAGVRVAGVLGLVRAVLAPRRPWRHRRPHRLRDQGASGPGGSGGERLAGARRGRRDDGRVHSRPRGAQGGRWHDSQRAAHAVPSRRSRRAGGTPDGRRDHLPRRGVRGGPGRGGVAGPRHAARQLAGGPALGTPDGRGRPGSRAPALAARRRPDPRLDRLSRARQRIGRRARDRSRLRSPRPPSRGGGKVSLGRFAERHSHLHLVAIAVHGQH